MFRYFEEDGLEWSRVEMGDQKMKLDQAKKTDTTAER